MATETEDTIELDRFTQFTAFEILAPRWHDKRVLMKANRVGEHNKLVFTGKQGKALGAKVYYVSGKTVKKYPKQSNGVIMCYSVPLHELKVLRFSERSLHEL